MRVQRRQSRLVVLRGKGTLRATARALHGWRLLIRVRVDCTSAQALLQRKHVCMRVALLLLLVLVLLLLLLLMQLLLLAQLLMVLQARASRRPVALQTQPRLNCCSGALTMLRAPNAYAHTATVFTSVHGGERTDCDE